MLISEIIIFIVSFFILVWASKILISSLTRIAVFMQISEYALSFIIIGVATSVPELFLAISSGFRGIPEISFGNIIGANLLNITLIVGLVAVIAGGIKSNSEIKKDIVPLLTIAFLPFIFGLDGKLSWVDGALLIIIYVWHLSWFLRKKHIFEKTNSELIGRSKRIDEKLEIKYRAERGLPLYVPYHLSIVRQVFMFLGAIVLLIIASFLIVNVAQSVTESLELGLVAFGIFAVALGTTIPELIFGIRSIMLKHNEMTVGNAFGSVAVNSTLVIGLAALISPVEVNLNRDFFTSMIFIALSLLAIKVFFKRDKGAISAREGLILISIYTVFMVLKIFL